MRRREIREIYEITRPRVPMSDLVYVHARNKSRVETCNLKLTEEIEEMFQDDFVMFVWAYFDPKGNLNIIERREKPNDWR